MLAATWITALATAGLFAGAIITAVYAIRAFGKQAQQVDLLQQQLKDEKDASASRARIFDLQAREQRQRLDLLDHEASERRRAQASHVLFWDERIPQAPGDPAGTGKDGKAHVVHVRNDSPLPVSQLEITWRIGTITLPGQPDRILQLLPGQEETLSRPVDFGDGELRFEANLSFRDAEGITWLRKPDGHLEEHTHS